MLRKSKEDDEPAVLQLQRMASDSRENLVDLLRKALAVATKLKLKDFATFIRKELNGYNCKPSELPDYRRVACRLRATNPANHRVMPVLIEDEEIAAHYSTACIFQSIGELQPFMSGGAERTLRSVLPQNEQIEMNRACGMPIPAELHREIGAAGIINIGAAVRNEILEWALKLEGEGILGEGMTFSKEERDRAAQSMTFNVGSIGNMQGNIGPITNSQVTQTLSMYVQADDLQSLRHELSKIGVSEDDFSELKQAIASDPKPVSKESVGPKTGSWIGGMVGKAATGALKVGADLAGKYLMTAVMQYYGLLPPSSPH